MNQVIVMKINGYGHIKSFQVTKITTKELNVVNLIKNIYTMIKNNLMK